MLRGLVTTTFAGRCNLKLGEDDDIVSPQEDVKSDGEAHRNSVVLVGRLAAPAITRTLPSGDLMTAFRVVVGRPPGLGSPARPRSPTVDTIDCVSWRADMRRRAEAWLPGDTIEVEGSLRRRFWRGSAGAASRSEVEVVQGRQLRKATGPKPARPARLDALGPAIGDTLADGSNAQPCGGMST